MSSVDAVIIHIRPENKQNSVQVTDDQKAESYYPYSRGAKLKAWKDLYQSDLEYRDGFRRLMVLNPLCDGLVEGAVLMTTGLLNEESSKSAMILLAISPLLSNTISSTFFFTGSHWRDNTQHDAINRPEDKLGQIKQKRKNATIIYHNAWMDIAIGAALALQLSARRYIPSFGPISTTACLAMTKTAISAIDLRDNGAWNSFRYQLKTTDENPWSRTVVQISNTISSIEMSFSSMVYAIGVLIAYLSLSSIGIDTDLAFGVTLGLICLSGILGAGPRITYIRKVRHDLENNPV